MSSAAKKALFFGGGSATPDYDPIYSLGSMANGSDVLTLSDAAGGTDYTSVDPSVRRPFEVGDTVIVEIGGEAGAGIFGTMGVGGVVTASLAGSYYQSLDAPKSLVAEILSIDGNELTLDATAFTATTDAKIYLDNTDAFDSQLSESHGPGWIVTWPAGKFAIRSYIGQSDISDWTIQGQGKGVTVLYTAKGTPNGGLLPSGDDWVIEDFTIIGNHGWNYFGLEDDGGTFAVGVGIWSAAPSNSIVRRIKVINVFKKAVWFDGGSGNQIIDCDMIANQPLKDYFAQWYFGTSDAADCTITRCTFTCPYLSQAFEAFRSTGVSFIDCTSHNGTFAFNSSGDWLLENFTFTCSAGSWLSDVSFSHTTPCIDINSNIQPPDEDMELGGIVRDISFTCEGAIDPTGNYLYGAKINSFNPNITFDGGTFTYPLIDNTAFPSIEVGAQAIYCPAFYPSFPSPDNVTANDLTVTGHAFDYIGNIHIDGAGAAVTNCTAEWIFENLNHYHNGVLVLSALPETVAWVAAVVSNGGTVSTARKSIVNKFITNLMNFANVWDRLDRVWMLSGENEPSALTDIVALELATKVSTPTFVASNGYTGEDLASPTKYINTGYNTTTDAVNYTLNSSHISAWLLTNVVATNGGAVVGAASGNDGTALFITADDDNLYIRNNNNLAGSLGSVPSTRIGHWLSSRTGASTHVVYRDGTSVFTPNDTVQGLYNGDIYALGYNSGGSPTDGSPNQIAMISMGDGFNGTDALNFWLCGRVFMNEIGVP